MIQNSSEFWGEFKHEDPSGHLFVASEFIISIIYDSLRPKAINSITIPKWRRIIYAMIKFLFPSHFTMPFCSSCCCRSLDGKKYGRCWCFILVIYFRVATASKRETSMKIYVGKRRTEWSSKCECVKYILLLSDCWFLNEFQKSLKYLNDF